MAKIVKVFSQNTGFDVEYEIDKYIKRTKHIPLQVSSSVALCMTDNYMQEPIERHTVTIIFETDISQGD
ncbi:hypothetical protein Phab24_id082 [Acinetobacter phage Phab24]|nr:hypothetical protein BS46_gp125 [Acinetobacter phage BS46]QXM18528.1 hypothetical protein Phab24_id082 [Acinetobacter phage Phab24]